MSSDPLRHMLTKLGSFASCEGAEFRSQDDHHAAGDGASSRGSKCLSAANDRTEAGPDLAADGTANGLCRSWRSAFSTCDTDCELGSGSDEGR